MRNNSFQLHTTAAHGLLGHPPQSSLHGGPCTPVTLSRKAPPVTTHPSPFPSIKHQSPPKITLAILELYWNNAKWTILSNHELTPKISKNCRNLSLVLFEKEPRSRNSSLKTSSTWKKSNNTTILMMTPSLIVPTFPIYLETQRQFPRKISHRK